MTVAIWIIAVCEIVRMLQNAVQIEMIRRDQSARGDLYTKMEQTYKAIAKTVMDDINKGDDGK